MASENLLEGFTEAELLAIRTQAKADLTAGRVLTSWSSGNTTTGKAFAATPLELLRLVRVALSALDPETYGARPTRARCNFNSNV